MPEAGDEPVHAEGGPGFSRRAAAGPDTRPAGGSGKPIPSAVEGARGLAAGSASAGSARGDEFRARPAAEVLADRLAAALVHHEPGWRLPRHTALARRYNVSTAQIDAAIGEQIGRAH